MDKENISERQKEYMTNQQKMWLIMMCIILGLAIGCIVAIIYVTGRNEPTIIIENVLPEMNTQLVEVEPQSMPFVEFAETSPPTPSPRRIEAMSLPVIEIIQPPEEEVIALAKMLNGECYDGELDDMRMVCWVVINRIEHEKFRDNIIDEVKAGKAHCPNGLGQFHGYREWNVPTDENLDIAREVLKAWYNGDYSMRDELFEDGMIALYFAASGGRTNTFREEYK